MEEMEKAEHPLEAAEETAKKPAVKHVKQELPKQVPATGTDCDEDLYRVAMAEGGDTLYAVPAKDPKFDAAFNAAVESCLDRGKALTAEIPFGKLAGGSLMGPFSGAGTLYALKRAEVLRLAERPWALYARQGDGSFGFVRMEVAPPALTEPPQRTEDAGVALVDRFIAAYTSLGGGLEGLVGHLEALVRSR